MQGLRLIEDGDVITGTQTIHRKMPGLHTPAASTQSIVSGGRENQLPRELRPGLSLPGNHCADADVRVLTFTQRQRTRVSSTTLKKKSRKTNAARLRDLLQSYSDHCRWYWSRTDQRSKERAQRHINTVTACRQRSGRRHNGAEAVFHPVGLRQVGIHVQNTES